MFFCGIPFCAFSFNAAAAQTDSLPIEFRCANSPENYLPNGDFEEYNVNTSLKNNDNADSWFAAVPDSGNINNTTWMNVTSTDLQAYSGKISLCLHGNYNTLYRKIENLEKNTDYIFGFHYLLPEYTDENLVNFARFSIVKGNTQTVKNSNQADVVSSKSVGKGTGKWQYEYLYFNSDDLSEYYLLFNYSGVNADMFVDCFTLNKVDECLPYFDSYCGNVICKYNQSANSLELTARENQSSGFRGWYKNGSEVSKSRTISEITPETAKDYSAVFYDFNKIDGGNFEIYALNQNMRNDFTDAKWYSPIKDKDNSWQKAEISNDFAKSGNKSLKIYSMYNSMYRKISGLGENDVYRLSFYYTFNAPTQGYDDGYLESVLIASDGSTIKTENKLSSGTKLAEKTFSAQTGSTNPGEWKHFEISFYRGDISDIYLSLKYNADAQSGVSLYIDDLTLTEDYSSDTTFNFEDFEKETNCFNSDGCTSISVNSSAFGSDIPAVCEKNIGKLNIKSSTASSTPYNIIKNKTYTFSSIINLKDFSDNNSAYLGIAISHSKKNYEDYIINGNSKTSVTATFKTLSGQTVLSSNLSESHISLTKNALKDYKNDFLLFSLTFTATESTSGCMLFRSTQSNSVIYLDNVSVCTSGTLNTNELIEQFGSTLIGSSIRVSGIQGLRYKTQINKRLLCKDNVFKASVSEYGTLVMRSDYMSSTDKLTVDGEYKKGTSVKKALRGVAYSENGVDRRYDETQDSIEYTGVLTNIKKDNYKRDYNICGYIIYTDENNNQHIYYSDITKVSIFSVAKCAYTARKNSTEYAENYKTRKYLKEEILEANIDNSITVKNLSPVITDNYSGINATVYHCYTFMKDRYGRNYTDEQAKKEMDRLSSSGITLVRTAFKSQWAWNDNKGWDWESDDMKAVYKWAGEMKKRNIDIMLTAGWSVQYITFPKFSSLQDRQKYNEQETSIPDTDYLYAATSEIYAESGNTYGYKYNRRVFADKYGESDGVDFTGLSDYEKRVKKASLRYGEWASQALLKFKALGLTNVKYLLTFTEPSRQVINNSAGINMNEGIYAEELIKMVGGLDYMLKKHGIRNTVKLVGPNQGSIDTGEGMLKYYLEYCLKHSEANDYWDILSTHTYASSNASIKDETFYYDKSNAAFSSYKDVLDRYNCKKPFWADEFFASSSADATYLSNEPIQLTQLAAGLTAAMKNGINRIISWQMFDQLWVNQNNTGGEFISGVHVAGTCPSFIAQGDYAVYASEIPRKTYYGLNLISKYLGGKKCKVYSVETDRATGLYTGAIKNDRGCYVIIAVNTTNEPLSLNVNFENDLCTYFSKFVYDPNGILPTSDATPISCDETISSSGYFNSVIPAYSFTIYLENNNQETDLDVEELVNI